MALTFVSALLDSEANSVKHCQLLIDKNLPLIVYVRPGQDTLLRAAAGVRVATIEHFPHESLTTPVRRVWASYRGSEPASEAVRSFAKYPLLIIAMRDNPFRTEHFAWIDPGVAGYCSLYGVGMVPYAPRIRLRMSRHYSRAGEDFALERRDGACSEYISGHVSKLRPLCDRILARLGKWLEAGFAGFDAEGLTIDYLENPKEYEPYYGGPQDVVAGARYAPESLLHVFAYLSETEWGSVQEQHILAFLRARRK